VNRRDYKTINLGQKILKFNVPKDIIDTINNSYENNILPEHNQYLAGKIKNQHRITEYLPDTIKDYFTGCFQLYLLENSFVQLPFKVKLLDAWINEMKEHEYNPMHTHRGMSYIGLSSVLCLKIPNTYGKEYSTEHSPCNGVLDIIGNNSGMFAYNQYRHKLVVGDLFVFPYDITHGVYPFHSTVETRRTMSYNCDLIIKN
jgi:hypothetical protein|tara:strand:+ start:1418 stop:2020 length:603 start_codon:yes stop_codon:yes gene_type:complete